MLDMQLLANALGDLDEPKITKFLNEFMATKPKVEEAQQVVKACQQGMAIVGDLFEKSEYFVGDLIFAGELLTMVINTLKPVLGEQNSKKIGSIVIGTVQGDLHDIGKNIFAGMANAAGFEVFDLGIDVSSAAFVEKVREVQPQIVGMSGVLTLSLDSMKSTVYELKRTGLRDNVKVIIGGNPVTEDACRMIGADAYTMNAVEGIKVCQGWMKYGKECL